MALLNDQVKKGGVMASSYVGGLKRCLYPGQRRSGNDRCSRSRCTDTGKTGSYDLCLLRRS
ncbi:MAG: hypothetical protein ACLU7M_02070 [Mediterraneibacter gnavus]